MNHWEFILAAVVILVLSLLVIGGILLILLLTKTRSKKWLLKELSHWKEEGLFDSQTIEKIENRYIHPHKESMPPTKIVTLIGSILFGIGLIIFVASNWQKIDDIVKLISLFTLSILFLFLGYWLKYREKNPLPILGEGLFLVASLIWGAVIIFLSQSFQVSEANNYILTFIWGATIFPLAIWFKSDPIYYLSYFMLFLSGIYLSNLRESPTYLFLLIAFIPFLLTSENKKHKWIPISALALFLPIFCNFEIYGIFYLALGLILILFWLYKKDEVYAVLASSSVFFFVLTSINHPLLKNYMGHWFFLVPLAFILVIAFIKNSVPSFYVLLFTFLIGLMTQFSYDDFGGALATSIFKIILLTGVIYLLIERNIKNKSIRLPFMLWGYLALIVSSFVLSFQDLIKESLNTPQKDIFLLKGISLLGDKNIPFFYFSLFFILVAGSLLLFRIFQKKNIEKGDVYLYVGSSLSIVGLLFWEILIISPATYALWSITIIQNAILLTIILLSIFWATKRHLVWLTNCSLVLFLLFVIFRYFDLSWKLLDRSFFFIGGGFILLLIGFFMEKLRRKLTSEENHEK
jgi:uncharacterized membrane protein